MSPWQPTNGSWYHGVVAQNEMWKVFHPSLSSNAFLLEIDVDRKVTKVIECISQTSGVGCTLMQHWHIFIKWSTKLYRDFLLSLQNGMQYRLQQLKGSRCWQKQLELGIPQEEAFCSHWCRISTACLLYVPAKQCCSGRWIRHDWSDKWLKVSFVRYSSTALHNYTNTSFRRHFSHPSHLIGSDKPFESEQCTTSVPFVHFDFLVEEILAFHRNVIRFV